MDAATARAALHDWIDQADDTLVIGLAELAAQFKLALEQEVERQLTARGLLPAPPVNMDLKGLENSLAAAVRSSWIKWLNGATDEQVVRFHDNVNAYLEETDDPDAPDLTPTA